MFALPGIQSEGSDYPLSFLGVQFSLGGLLELPFFFATLPLFGPAYRGAPLAGKNCPKIKPAIAAREIVSKKLLRSLLGCCIHLSR